MRVIAGIYRGKNLRAPNGLDVRPTTGKVKEAVFSSIHFLLPGAYVLDLFAGSGQMGIEALSRGAEQVLFVDASPESIAVIKENLAALPPGVKAWVVQAEAGAFLKGTAEHFDIAFLDPPYNKNLLPGLLPILEPKMSEGATIICEHEAGLFLPDIIGVLHQTRRRKYGLSAVTIFQ